MCSELNGNSKIEEKVLNDLQVLNRRTYTQRGTDLGNSGQNEQSKEAGRCWCLCSGQQWLHVRRGWAEMGQMQVSTEGPEPCALCLSQPGSRGWPRQDTGLLSLLIPQLRQAGGCERQAVGTFCSSWQWPYVPITWGWNKHHGKEASTLKTIMYLSHIGSEWHNGEKIQDIWILDLVLTLINLDK